MDELLKQFATELKSLPSPLQSFILEGSWEDKLNGIAARFGLNEDQLYDLRTEVALVLFCLETPEDLDQNISAITSPDKTSAITTAIKNEVLKEVEVQLKNENGGRDSKEREFTEKYNKLPQNIQAVLDSDQTEKRILDIGKKYNLHVDQLGKLVEEVGQTLVGSTKPGEFAGHIQNKLAIDQTTASNLTTEVNNEIFLPLRESLQQIGRGEGEMAPATSSILAQKMGGTFTLPKEPVDPYHEPIN